jgi:hypothetical protein
MEGQWEARGIFTYIKKLPWSLTLGGAILHKGETGAIQVRHEEHLYSNNYIKTKVH